MDFRRRASSYKSGKKYKRVRISAALYKPILKDESLDDPSATDGKLEDGGDLSTGKQKEDGKEDIRKEDGKESQETILDLKETTLQTMTLHKEENPKGDIESSSMECTKKYAKEE